MANGRIREEMMLAGVSITELADKLGITDEDMVGRLNSDMGIMENFRVMSAITEIARGKERA